MPRPRLPVGEHGKISRRQLDDGRWVASCWVRDEDGKRRHVTKTTPPNTRDRTGAVAERTLTDSLKNRHIDHNSRLNATSTIHQLWTEFWKQLLTQGRSHNTLRDYDRQSKAILTRFGDLHIREVTTQALDTFIQDVANQRGVPTARKNRTILLGMFKIAVRFKAIDINPIRELSSIEGKRKKQAQSLDAQSLAQLLQDLRTSTLPCPVVLSQYQIDRGQKTTDTHIPTVAEFCASNDMADIITLFAATGCRISELLAIRINEDIDLETKTASVTGQIVRIRGQGLVRQDLTKSEAGDGRVLPLPQFAVDMLTRRRQDSTYVFESRAGTILDPETVQRRWRQIRTALDLATWAATAQHNGRRAAITSPTGQHPDAARIRNPATWAFVDSFRAGNPPRDTLVAPISVTRRGAEGYIETSKQPYSSHRGNNPSKSFINGPRTISRSHINALSRLYRPADG